MVDPRDAGYRCVACRGALAPHADTDARGVAGAGVVCRACGAGYPVLADRVPVLVADARAHLAASAAAVERMLGELRGKVELIDQLARRGAGREAALAALRSALIGNARFLRERLTELGQVLDAVSATPSSQPGRAPAPAPPAAAPPASARLHPNLADPALGYFADVFDYVRQDWSSLPDCRDDVDAILGALRAHLAAHASGARRALVLGAGLGRFAWELRERFERTIAVDLSVLMALTYAAIRDRGVRVFEINERIAYDVAGLARAIDAPRPTGPGDLDYCVADARRIPLADGAVDVVVSAFFTDVVRMTSLLSEVRRVLAPGGVFVHFGPLGYHFYAPEHMWTAEEARGVFDRCGFEVRDEAWVPVWLQRSTARMTNVQVDAWSFAAVARD